MKYAMICVSFLFMLDIYAAENDRMQKYAEEAWQGRSFVDAVYEQIYGFSGKVIFDKRETPLILQQLNCPESSADNPKVKKLIDLANMVIDKFNSTPAKTKVLNITTLQEEWEQAEGKFQRKYDKSGGEYNLILKFGYQTREDKAPSIIFVDGFGLLNYPVPNDKTMLLPGLRILLDEEGKVKYVACFYPPLNEDFVYILRRTESGWQFLSFSLENETAQPGPYLLWDKEGKIIEKSTRTLYFRDYDTPVDSSQILLRDSKPHEFWIPSESAKTSIGH